MTLDFFNFFSIFTSVFALVNVYLYFKGFARNGKAFKIFTLNLALVTVIQISAFVIGKVFHQPNLFLSHLYFIVQFIFLSWFYSLLLKSVWPRGILILGLLLIGYQYIDDSELFFRYNAMGMATSHIIIVVYAVLFLYRSLNGSKIFVTATIGIFLYLLSSALIFASGNLVFNFSENTMFTLINVNRVLTLVYHILIFTEWYKNFRSKSLNPA